MPIAPSSMDKACLATSALVEANGLLTRLRDLSRRAEGIELRASAEIAHLSARHSIINEIRYQIEVLDREIKTLMNSRRAEIFTMGDKVILPAGILFHSQEKGVSIPRKALDLIKAHGWWEAVRTSESINRSVVESWPMDRIKAIGARERTVKRFAYTFHDSR